MLTVILYNNVIKFKFSLRDLDSVWGEDACTKFLLNYFKTLAVIEYHQERILANEKNLKLIKLFLKDNASKILSLYFEDIKWKDINPINPEFDFGNIDICDEYFDDIEFYLKCNSFIKDNTDVFKWKSLFKKEVYESLEKFNLKGLKLNNFHAEDTIVFREHVPTLRLEALLQLPGKMKSEDLCFIKSKFLNSMNNRFNVHDVKEAQTLIKLTKYIPILEKARN